MRNLFFILTLLVCSMAYAANTKTTVSQVTSAVEVTDAVDYIITSTTPFTTAGSIDIKNFEHGAVIIQAIKPSKVLSTWLSYVKINGEPAVDGTNCQVKMYARGTIIFPYAADFAPLTCYTEPDFGGESCNTYREGNSGGFMLSLGSSTLNNKIRSFKLKRGYMVTFALGTAGWGYSRCFIAHDEDLEMNMPTNMDARVSSYRLFKWHYAHKAGLASDGRLAANAALNASWCYDWGQGNASLEPDIEWVPNHIYEDWPPVGTCGGVTQSCHMKTNNEPGNSADDHPQDVETVLANWPNLMRTGMRLCSESSHDGSLRHLKAFIDSIDAYGWRCDILDLHCYWSGGFDNGNMVNYSNNYGNGRPIWISEWIWGASWNNNGCWGWGVTDSQIYDTTVGILNMLNQSAIVERYAYWNSESKGKIYENDRLTTLGQYYGSMDVGLGYNKAKEFVPRVVNFNPYNLTGTYNKSKGTYALSWSDKNYDMLDSITVECKQPGTTKYARVTTISSLKDQNSSAAVSYSYTDTLQESGAYYYRVCAYPMGARTPLYSNEISISVSASFGDETLQYGKLPVTDLNVVSTSFSDDMGETPTVFMGLCSNNNTALYPGNLVTSAGKTKFSYQILPFQAQSSAATRTMSKMEELAFLAAKPGNYKFGNLDCEIGTVSGKDTIEVTFKQPFPEGVTPIVLLELRNPTLKTNPISTNIFDLTNTGFKIAQQYEASIAATSTIRVNLTVCYLAITPGLGTMLTEFESSDVVKNDTVSSETFHLEGKDSIAYVIDQTIRDTYSNIVIASGTGENEMYGSSLRDCTFRNADGSPLYFKNPKIFGKCQTSRYTGANILRMGAFIKETDESSEHYGYVTGVKVKRQFDGTNKDAKTTSAYSDPLGYVVIDSGDDTYKERIEQIQSYDIIPVVPVKVEATAVSKAPASVVAIYNLNGAPLPSLQKGFNIVKYSDGSFKKVLKK